MTTDRKVPPPPPPKGAAPLGAPARPLPPPAHARPAPPALAPGQTMSQAAKDAIAESALGLLEEQLEAKVVHYKAELETNPELDAITAQIVAQLRQMQEQRGIASGRAPEQREAVAAQQEKTLRGLLERLFPTTAPSLVMQKRIKGVLRNLARLFFQSELHERTRGQESLKTIQHGEQAMFYLLTRYHNRMHNELECFEYISPEIRERSFELLGKLTKDMQDAFLARRSNELKRLVGVFSAVLVDFLARELPKCLPELAREVVAQSGSAEGKAFGYKIAQAAFPKFRATFERRVMVRLVSFAEDELVRRLADTAGPSREETIKFISNPEVFSMILGQVAEGAYEYLCNEGFLDLPPEWVSAQDSG